MIISDQCTQYKRKLEKNDFLFSLILLITVTVVIVIVLKAAGCLLFDPLSI
jgi:hypothetical protein